MSNKKPNVLFLFADDQRYDTINAINNPDIITPNLDKLVKRGTTFTHAHIPCGTSGAVCMPSRAMLHTARTLFHLQDEGQQIPKEHVTMGETFKQNGYNAFGIGKWHNGTESYTRSFSDGKSVFFGGMWDHWNVPSCDYNADGIYPEATSCIGAFQSNETTQVRVEYMQFGKHSTDIFADRAIEFLDDYKSENPFFLYVSFMAPHDPRTMPQKYIDMYNDTDINLPANFAEEHAFDYGIRDVRDEVLAPYPRTEENTLAHIKEYYAMISHLDARVGDIINKLEETGELENTIIVYSGDNGLAIGKHGLFGKQNHYEHSIRVPLIFAGPNIPQNERRDTYVYLLDIFPTLCEMLKIKPPETVEGKSMLTAIKDADVVVRENLFFAYCETLRSVKSRQYKLIEYRTENLKKTQLFDLISDPDEICDLFADDSYSEVIAELKDILMSYRASWEDTGHVMSKEFWSRY